MVTRFIVLLIIVAFALASHVYLWCHYLDINRNPPLSKIWWLALGLLCDITVAAEVILVFLISNISHG